MTRATPPVMKTARLPSPTLLRRLGGFAADRNGGTAIEYALVAAGVAVAISATIVNLGADVKTNLYDKLTTLF